MYASQLYPTANESMAAVTSDAGVLMLWILDESVDDHCDSCLEFADGGPYSDPDDDVEGADPLPAFPGDGTDCLTNCRCTLEFEQSTWDDYAEAHGLAKAA